MKNEKLKPWLPAVIFGIATAGSVIYYAASGGRQFTTYLQLVIALVLPAVVPVLGLIFKKPYPVSLSVIIGILVLLGLDFAKAFSFYSFFPEYDKLLHTVFGLVGSAIIYIFIVRWNGESLSGAGVAVLVFLGVMGLGALWEILEYYCSFIPGEDPQGVWGVIDAAIASGERGLNPLYDTIEDLIVTILGSAVFVACYFADKRFGGKIFKKLFKTEEVITAEHK